MSTAQKEIEEQLYTIYGTFKLDVRQTALALHRSKSTLGRWREEGIYLVYSKIGTAKNAPIRYPIDEVAKFIIANKIKVN